MFLTSIHTLGGSGTFWAIGAMAGAGWVWAWAVLPETKGLGLDDIQRLFAGKGVGAGGAEVGLTRLGS